MTRIVIAKGGGFTLISIGNGLAYEFGRAGADRTVFVQGDDALAFREQWEAMETARPHAPTTALLRELWEQYS